MSAAQPHVDRGEAGWQVEVEQAAEVVVAQRVDPPGRDGHALHAVGQVGVQDDLDPVDAGVVDRPRRLAGRRDQPDVDRVVAGGQRERREGGEGGGEAGARHDHGECTLAAPAVPRAASPPGYSTTTAGTGRKSTSAPSTTVRLRVPAVMVTVVGAPV